MNKLQSLYTKMPIGRELHHMGGLAMNTRALKLIEQQRYRDELRVSPRATAPGRLGQFEAQVFSQNGEDGILDEIFRRVGTTNRRFCEIAAGNGLENNTTYRLAQGWTGAWFEASSENTANIRANFASELADGRLYLSDSFVTVENIDSILTQARVAGDIDLLSLDIDMNTFWIWKAMKVTRARVVVIEYNSVFPPHIDWSAAYKPNSVWRGDSYMGCSIKALELLGRDLGYSLVGCDFTGSNAFFVDDKLVGDRFFAPFTSDVHYEPCRYFLDGRNAHPRGWGPGVQTKPEAADGSK